MSWTKTATPKRQIDELSDEALDASWVSFYAIWPMSQLQRAEAFIEEAADTGASNVYGNRVQDQIEVHFEVNKEEVADWREIVKGYGGKMIRG
jgi:hypothetical protein